MTPTTFIIICMGIGVVAFLYSSVGHAGASGYIAVMSLAELEPQFIKPTALLLNVLVATIATWQFARQGHFCWRLFWPFALFAIPMAFVGGYLNLSTMIFKIVLGGVLWFSAFRFLIRPSDDWVAELPKLSVALPAGAGLGFLAGLTGTGGGIFLTPMLLIMRWATAKQAAAVSALFILFNSIAGLIGNLISTQSVAHLAELKDFAFPFAIAVVCGGMLGSYWGSHKFLHTTIKRLLATVLLIAGTKLIMTAVE